MIKSKERKFTLGFRDNFIQMAFGFEGSLASAPAGRNELPVLRVVEIPSDEDSLDADIDATGRDDITFLVHFELPREEYRVGNLADGEEDAVALLGPFLPGLTDPEPDSLDPALPEDVHDLRVPDRYEKRFLRKR